MIVGCQGRVHGPGSSLAKSRTSYKEPEPNGHAFSLLDDYVPLQNEMITKHVPLA